MEVLTNTTKKDEHLILLCKKCFENGEYSIPLFKINGENKNIIEFKCHKPHDIKINDLLKKKIDQNLKEELGKCKEHKENVFCGWCEECDKNICFECINQRELKKKHKYILFFEEIPDSNVYDIYIEKIDKLEKLLNEYKLNDENYLYNPLMINEINGLQFFLLAYYLYYIEEIRTYQTIKNILNLKDIIIDYSIKQKLFYNEYRGLFSTLNESKDSINKTKFKLPSIPSKKEQIRLFPLIDNNNNENNDNITNLNNNKNYFVLIYMKIFDLYIYDINGEIINKIQLESLKLDNIK
jgi:hypothetical protein